jgi:thiol-disulfide isomerase/thioredoxin
LLTTPAHGAENLGAAARAQTILHLNSGSFAAGKLVDSPTPNTLRWQADAFATPFEFALGGINAIHWPPPDQPKKPAGDYAFELAAGDVLFGSLVDLNDTDVEIETQRTGRFNIDRANVHRIFRWRDSSDLVYLGPTGLAGWKPFSQANANENGWREESGQLVTDKEGVAVRGDFGIPVRATIEFELSWRTKPDFVFAIGVDDSATSLKRAFRFEAWGGDLVIERELESEADLARIQEIVPGPGRIHLHVFLDQSRGHLLVFSQGGKKLAELKLASPKPVALPGLALSNLHGDLRLEWLRIGRWSGELPREVNADLARIHRGDGTIAYGRVSRFESANQRFILKSENGESAVPASAVTSIFLSLPSEDRLRALRAVYLDGTRLSGELARVENGALVLEVPGVKSPLRLPIEGLRSLVFLRRDENAQPKGGAGRIELDGLNLPGQLVDGQAQPGATCLVWKPLESKTASALRPGVAAKIIYKEPPPPRPTARPSANRRGMVVQMQAVQQPQGVAGMVMRFAQALSEPAATAPVRERRALFLKDGDVIPSIITKIDELGVYFTSSLSSSTFVPHEKVKAVELIEQPPNSPVRLTKSKRERLLTLPRMQKPDPPSHLVRSASGDYVRGRVIKLDQKTLQLEVRLETKDIPRGRVSQIIWLHSDELDAPKQAAAPPPSGATRVQALRNDGVRLTFGAERFSDGTLSGKSDVLGPCAVKMDQTDQLLISGAIDQAAAQLAYQQWKLKNAPEPKFVQSDGGENGDGSPATGTESPLVGKPAPDFDLELLDGKKFHLAEGKGKVIILDFWATWCGPCLQAMPQVEKVAHELEGQGVQLVAVNLQETPDQIKSMLERYKLKMTVALDRDGIVADKYKAVAIPQTVVVNREGTIARLFVGGGSHFEDQLRDAVKAVLAGEKGKDAPEKPGQAGDRLKTETQRK